MAKIVMFLLFLTYPPYDGVHCRKTKGIQISFEITSRNPLICVAEEYPRWLRIVFEICFFRWQYWTSVWVFFVPPSAFTYWTIITLTMWINKCNFIINLFLHSQNGGFLTRREFQWKGSHTAVASTFKHDLH